MIIVWGSNVTNKVVSTGQFYCLACRQQRGYKLRQPKEWATVFWIPIFPLKEFERYVECDACNATFGELVLHDPDRAQRELDDEHERDANLARMICQVMALMAGERDGVSARLAGEIANAVRHILKREMPPEAIHAALTAGPIDPEAVLGNVERQAAALTDRGKELVVRAAAVAARKPLSDGSRALAAEVGRRLGVAPARVAGVLADFGMQDGLSHG
jgi:hypothetical protein